LTAPGVRRDRSAAEETMFAEECRAARIAAPKKGDRNNKTPAPATYPPKSQNQTPSRDPPGRQILSNALLA
jgi:hypothetical protein